MFIEFAKTLCPPAAMPFIEQSKKTRISGPRFLMELFKLDTYALKMVP